MTGVGNDGFVVGLPAIPPPTCPGRVVGRLGIWLGIWGRVSPGVGAGFVAMPG
jgi:hypothetical protein